MNDLTLIVIIIILMVLLPLGAFGLYVLNNKDSTEKEKMTTRQLMYIVNLTALATVIGFIEIPLGTIIPGGKLDFSEVIILISFIVIGFNKTLLVIFLRSFVRFFMIPNELDFIMKLLGEGIAVTASLIIMSSYALITRLVKTHKKPLMYACEIEESKVKKIEWITIPFGVTIVLIGLLMVFHYFITVPAYAKLFGVENIIPEGFNLEDGKLTFIAKMVIILPFNILNLIKGILSTIIFLLAREQIEKVVK